MFLSRRHALQAGLACLTLTPLIGSPRSIRAREATPAAVFSDGAGLVDIGSGGRLLWLDGRGAGSPTVILEAGAGNNGQIWDTIGLPAGSAGAAVLPGVAGLTRVYAYDRPNTYLDPEHPSRSDRAPNPRSAAGMVADLHAALAAAAVPGPYVLVGHSFGGLLVRLFAATYPNDVVGLVLVDAAHEDWWQSLEGLLTAEQLAALYAEPAGYPGLEQIDTNASADQLREGVARVPLSPIPLVVLTHGVPWDWPPGYPVEAIEEVWKSLQDQLAALVPAARLIIAERSQHYIQITEPELVIDAIRQVVETVRESAA